MGTVKDPGRNRTTKDNNAAPNRRPAFALPESWGTSSNPSRQVPPEKAKIALNGAERLCKEVRIDKKFRDRDGEKVKLKPGAEVEFSIQAPFDAVQNKTA